MTLTNAAIVSKRFVLHGVENSNLWWQKRDKFYGMAFCNTSCRVWGVETNYLSK